MVSFAAAQSVSAGAFAGNANASDPGRIVAIGEEFLLADLLALGITPVASTATVDTVGFQGLDAYDTDGIEILPVYGLNLEQVAALRPDRIVTTAFMVEQAGGPERLEALAELVVVPEGVDTAWQVRYLGRALDRKAEAKRLVQKLKVANRKAKALAGTEVAVASVYPGAAVAAYVAPPSPFVTTLTDAGAVLVPGSDVGRVDASGRIFLSEEQIDLLGAPRLVLLQSDTVDGEPEALEEVEKSALWQRLPAVAAAEVTVLDRLGYPGAEGRIRLVDDLLRALR
jgi:ABC-type Fe3+-hydroxamate transport system substrate-binding protein